jgi:hypothetical protein
MEERIRQNIIEMDASMATIDEPELAARWSEKALVPLLCGKIRDTLFSFERRYGQSN